MVFTHQGAEWANPSFASIHDLQYPPQQPNLTIVERQASNERQADVRNYGRFGRAIMNGEIVLAVIWARDHDVPLAVTEFGVYRNAPPPSRALWLRDVRTALEKNKVGWSVWKCWVRYQARTRYRVRPDPTSARPLFLIITQRWSRSMLAEIMRFAWLLADQGVFAATDFIANILFARWLSPIDYGLFAVSFSGYLLLTVVHFGAILEPLLVQSAKVEQNRLHSYIST